MRIVTFPGEQIDALLVPMERPVSGRKLQIPPLYASVSSLYCSYNTIVGSGSLAFKRYKIWFGSCRSAHNESFCLAITTCTLPDRL